MNTYTKLVSVDLFTDQDKLIPFRNSTKCNKVAAIKKSDSIRLFTKFNGLSYPLSLGFVYYRIHRQGIIKEIHYLDSPYIQKIEPTEYILKDLDNLTAFSSPLLSDFIHLFCVNNCRAYPFCKISLL